MLLDSREIEDWQDFPFRFKQLPEVNESLFVLSIYTFIDNFTMAEFSLPDDMISVDDLAAVLTGPVTTNEPLMIVLEREKRVLKLIGSEAQVEETKRSIELLTGKNLLCELLPQEISCWIENDADDSRLENDADDSRGENEADYWGIAGVEDRRRRSF